MFLAILATFLSFVAGWDISNDNDRCGCQAYSKNPLQGCDKTKTVYVDPVPGKAKFSTVQSGEFVHQKHTRVVAD
jgi:hypothetical protein